MAQKYISFVDLTKKLNDTGFIYIETAVRQKISRGRLYYKSLIFSPKLESSLNSLFITLSFMALLVFNEIKLSDKGLFDANTFKFIYPFLSCN